MVSVSEVEVPFPGRVHLLESQLSLATQHGSQSVGWVRRPFPGWDLGMSDRAPLASTLSTGNGGVGASPPRLVQQGQSGQGSPAASLETLVLQVALS